MDDDILKDYKLSVMDNGDIIRVMRDIISSAAFGELTANSIRIYLKMLGKRRVPESEKQKARNGRKKSIQFYNGNIVYPYNQVMDDFNIKSRSTVRDCFDQLTELGFLEINHRGGGTSGDMTTYFISEKWRGYGSKNFQAKKRIKNPNYGGITKENWKQVYDERYKKKKAEK